MAASAELTLAVQALGAIEATAAASRALSAARAGLEAHLARAVSAFIYPGLVVDLRDHHNLPECFINVRTMKGADRGTRVFRIESLPSIDVNTSHIDLSYWRCDATPISEKTGKDMSGASHGADSRATVRLQAHIVHPHDYDWPVGVDYTRRAHQHLLKFIEKAEAAASARYLTSIQQFESPAPAPSTTKPRVRKP